MAWIESHWKRATAVSALLAPVSLLYGAATGLRRAAYRCGVAAGARLPVPVVVIGNITVGGTGKTPLALWLVEFLRRRGRTPGIVCRGYGGRTRAPQRVLPESDPLVCGDEAVLLARRSGCEVWIGVDRVAAARSLLAAQPACDVVVSDDGLQHYALARDIEICVVDAARGFGNGWLLPGGPLREAPSRLAAVDAVVVNGVEGCEPHSSISRLPGSAAHFTMLLKGREFRNLLDPSQVVSAEHFRNLSVHAIAGIGNPQRFFRHLQGLGLEFTAHAFPDHHAYRASDIAFPDANAIVMTEKDAVKCGAFAGEHWWALAVDAEIDPAFGELVLGRIVRGT
jgi:tetraacyldisaccharide 4'-kinase